MSVKFEVLSLEDLRMHRELVLAQLRQIFFQTSPRKLFRDEAEKDRFFFNWTDFYIKNFPAQLLLAVETGSDLETAPNVLGYLTGSNDSRTAAVSLANRIRSFTVFEDLFKDFPAHFHINFDPAYQGQGIGTALVNHYKSLLVAMGCSGVHIVTAADARNVSFYFRNGFTEQWEREYLGSRLKFMGCKLT